MSRKPESRPLFVIKAVCCAASRLAPMPRKSAYTSTFTPRLSQFASVPSKLGTPMVCLQLQCCKGFGSDSLQPQDYEVLLSRRSNTGRRVKLLSQQLCNSTIARGTVAAPLPCLNVRLGDGDATACVIWHSYGLMRCKDETVSTLVCMCKYISLHVCKSEHSLPMSERVAEEVWTSETQFV